MIPIQPFESNPELTSSPTALALTPHAARKARFFDVNVFDSADQGSTFIESILESSTEYSIIGKDLDGKIQLWNEGARRNYGYEPEEVLGRINSSVLHTPEDVVAGRHLLMLSRAMDTGKWEGNIVRLRKNGERFNEHVVITPRRDTSHQPIGYLLISKDITADLQADQKIETLEQQARNLARTVESVRQKTLMQSNERIEALEQKARDMAWFVETTRQQTLLQSDKKIEALEQKARDLADFVETLQHQTRVQSEIEIEALGQKARDLALFVENARKETRLQSETEIAALGQKARDLAISVESVREKTLLQSDNEIATLGQKARDLALFVEGVRKETRLQSESEIASLGQKARDLAVSVETVREKTMLQSDSEIASLGQQARDLAVSVETVREKTLQESDSEIATLGQQARDLAVTVETEREETLLQSDTEIETLKRQARNLALSVEKSRIETLLASDKVTRKLNEELEQRVLERTGQLEAANKELEAFSYSVSHDLRAPLRAIDGFSRIVMEEHAALLPKEGKAYLKLVRDNTKQMAQLVDDLLAFSRLSRLALTRQTIDPARMVRRCLQELQAEQTGRQIEIRVGEMPSCQGDPTLLKQVWTNLLSNALKYTRKCDVARIEIGCRTQPRTEASGACVDSENVFFIKDNGAGFDMKYAHKLFGVFQRLHRAADYDGTGVGLAIVQRIIHRHGGRVWGEAQVNQGATFSFTLE